MRDERPAGRMELREAETGLASFKTWKRAVDELRTALAADDPELRQRMRSHLQQFIPKIEVFAKGHRRPYDPARVFDTLQQLRQQSELDEQELRLHPDLREARDGDRFVEWIEALAQQSNPELLEDGHFCEFVKHVAERRMTKEGRFYRIHFTTGATVDVVPAGSLASGWELVKGGRKLRLSPEVDRLWLDWKPS